MDRNIFRCFDSDTHPVSPNFHHEDRNVIIDYDTFVYPTGENQHGNLSAR